MDKTCPVLKSIHIENSSEVLPKICPKCKAKFLYREEYHGNWELTCLCGFVVAFGRIEARATDECEIMSEALIEEECLIMTTKQGEGEQKIKEKIFRLKEEEDAKLPEIIEFACRAGYLQKPSFQEFMVFCINCTYARLKNEYEQRKGRR